jgi:hypothetical protein
MRTAGRTVADKVKGGWQHFVETRREREEQLEPDL